jgi:hypothetical protein
MLNQFITRLQARQPLPPLFPRQVWDAALSQEIQNAPGLSDNERAGLLLWNDDLEASHTISQGITTPTGSFWHAIMHRREGDAGNSLYWWRRTGQHPAFAEIYQAVLPVLESESEKGAVEFKTALSRAETWLPDEFVRHCERARNGEWLQRVQEAEMKALVHWCHQNNE